MKKVVLAILIFYKKTISPLFVILFGHACRYNPTCSEYSISAVDRFGAYRGFILAAKRVGRCHPLSKHQHFDPVPESLAE